MVKRYPADWMLRRRFIIKYRAQNRCEWCGARNDEPHPETGSHVALTLAHVWDKRRNRHPCSTWPLCANAATTGGTRTTGAGAEFGDDCPGCCGRDSCPCRGHPPCRWPWNSTRRSSRPDSCRRRRFNWRYRGPPTSTWRERKQETSMTDPNDAERRHHQPGAGTPRPRLATGGDGGAQHRHAIHQVVPAGKGEPGPGVHRRPHGLPAELREGT